MGEDRGARWVLELDSTSPAETEAIAARLAALLEPGDVVLVEGELGSGKTTFVRGAARSLGVEGAVTSPTYTIGHRYHGRVDVSHLDLYRFELSEIEAVGPDAAELAELTAERERLRHAESLRAAAIGAHAGAAGDEEESEADAELAEQLAEMGSTYEDPSQLKPGEPVFMYACAVSEEEQSKAYAEAFARAKASAEQLSRAAGIELGPLRGLSAQENPYGNLGNNYFGGYNDPMAQRVQQIVAEQAAASGGRREEAIGSQPNEVTLPVQVTASFDIKQPDKK